MPAFPGTPKVLRAGLVVADPTTLAIQRIIALQYNPDSLTRSLTDPRRDRPKLATGWTRCASPGRQSKRSSSMPNSTPLINSSFPNQNPNAVQYGLHPQLAALETLIYPLSAQIQSDNNLAMGGTIEVAPMEAPLTLFVWSANRVVPVRITEFSVTEEAFDTSLNPIRAKVEPRDAGAQRQRSRTSIRRATDLSRLPAAQGDAGRQRSGR